MGEAAMRLKTILKEGESELLRSLGIRGDYRRISDTIRTTWGDEVDFLAFVEEPYGRPFIAHVETQTSRDPEMTNRMLARYAAIWRWAAERREFKDAYIRPTVLYFGSARWKPKTVIDEFNLRFEHGFISAGDIDPGPLLESGNLGDAVFSVLCRGGKRPGVVRRAIERIAAAPPDERFQATAALIALSDLRGIGDAVRSKTSISSGSRC